jgi:hypothetical protein
VALRPLGRLVMGMNFIVFCLQLLVCPVVVGLAPSAPIPHRHLFPIESLHWILIIDDTHLKLQCQYLSPSGLVVMLLLLYKLAWDYESFCGSGLGCLWAV